MALTFDGTDDYLAIGDDPALSIAGPCSLILYYKKTTAYCTGDDHALGWGYYGQDPSVVLFARKSNGSAPDQVSCYLRDADGRLLSIISSDTQLIDDTDWHHIVVTLTSGGTAAIFVDGVQGSSATNSSFAGIDREPPFILGARGDGTANYVDGSVAEVAMIGKVLSSAEMAEAAATPVMRCSFAGDANWCLPLLSDTTEAVEGLTVTTYSAPVFGAVDHPVSYGGVWPHHADQQLSSMLSMGL